MICVLSCYHFILDVMESSVQLISSDNVIENGGSLRMTIIMVPPIGGSAISFITLTATYPFGVTYTLAQYTYGDSGNLTIPNALDPSLKAKLLLVSDNSPAVLAISPITVDDEGVIYIVRMKKSTDVFPYSSLFTLTTVYSKLHLVHLLSSFP